MLRKGSALSRPPSAPTIGRHGRLRVEADLDGESVFYLLAPAGGGLTCETDDGNTVTVLGPAAPLKKQLLGKTTGDILEDPPLMILEVM